MHWLWTALFVVCLAFSGSAQAQEWTAAQERLVNKAVKADNRKLRFAEKEQWDKVVLAAEEGLALRIEAFGPQHEYLIVGMNDLITIEMALGRVDRAIDYAERTNALRVMVAEPDMAGIADTERLLGMLRWHVGDAQGAVNAWEAGLEAYALAGLDRAPGVAECHEGIGRAGMAYGQLDLAAHHYQQALPVYEEIGDLHGAALCLSGLGQVAREYGDLDASLAYFEAMQQRVEADVGPTHPSVAVALSSQAAVLISRSEYEAAEALYRRALDIEAAAYGSGANELGSIMANLGSAIALRGDYAAAEPILRDSLARMEATMGVDSPDLSAALSGLATVYSGTSRPLDQMLILKRWERIDRAAFGLEHPDTLTAIGRLAGAYTNLRRFSDAEALIAEWLAGVEVVYGPDSAQMAAPTSSLADSIAEQGRFSDALPLAQHAHDLVVAAWGPDDSRVRSYQIQLAWLTARNGQQPQALEMYRQILARVEAQDGPNSLTMGVVRTRLGDVFANMARYDMGQPQFERAISIFEALNGDRATILVAPLTGLARCQQGRGELVLARRNMERALDIAERNLGPDHPQVAVALNNLGGVLVAQGDHSGASLNMMRGYDIQVSTLGEGHPTLGTLLVNMGNAMAAGGLYDDAELAYSRGEAIFVAAYGPDHVDVAVARQGLAGVLLSSGKFPEAVVAYRDVLALQERILGADHAMLSSTISSLATAESVTDNHPQAIVLLRRAIALEEAAGGTDSLQVGELSMHLALELRATGEHKESRALLQRAMLLHRDQLQQLLDVSSESERLGIVAERESLVFAYLTVFDKPDDVVDRYEAVLAWKGLVASAAMGERIAIAESDDPAVQARVNELSFVRAAIAHHVFDKNPGPDARASLLMLNARKGELQRELSALVATTGAHTANARELCDKLPAGAVLVDFFEHAELAAMTDQIGEYSAFVLKGGQCDTVTEVSLGESAPVHKALGRWRRTLDTAMIPVNVVDKAGGELRQLVWDPVEEAIGDVDLVLVVPGGQLASLAFAGLPDAEGGGYLIERQTIGYLENAQRLAAWPSRRHKITGSALVVGGVDYGGNVETVQLASRGGSSCDMKGFPQLAGTVVESDAISELLTDRLKVTRLSGDGATEQTLQQSMVGKSVVHLATHGFFAGKTEGCGERHTGSWLASGLNPMSLSGLVLSGANDGGHGGFDGLWTAEEVSAMQLDDTDLVVLSACETGLGRLSGGEGVMGLRRALGVAGADTVVMSLWTVDDEATRLLMTEFYGGMFDAKDPAGVLEALRDAQLQTIRHFRDIDGEANPRLWAAFIASGDPR